MSPTHSTFLFLRSSSDEAYTECCGLQMREGDVVEVVLESVDQRGNTHFQRLGAIVNDSGFEFGHIPE